MRACTACFDLCATGLMLRNTLTLLFFLVMTRAKDAPRQNRVSCSCDFAAVLGAVSIQVIFRALSHLSLWEVSGHTHGRPFCKASMLV